MHLVLHELGERVLVHGRGRHEVVVIGWSGGGLLQRDTGRCIGGRSRLGSLDHYCTTGGGLKTALLVPPPPANRPLYKLELQYPLSSCSCL